MSSFDRVSYFNNVCGNSAGDKDDPDWSIAESQLQIIAEEFFELHQAIEDKDVTAMRDGIADTLVTVYGLAYRMGVDADSDMDTVCNSNMSKLCITDEEVEATLKHYADMNVAVYATDDELPVAVRSTCDHTVGGKFYPKAKILKSIYWQSPDLK